MKGGRLAYRLTIGVPTAPADRVDSFSPVDSGAGSGDPDQQSAYYEQWLASLSRADHA
jgi:hypothetical protein